MLFESNFVQQRFVANSQSRCLRYNQFNYIRPGDYSVECFAKVQRNFIQTTFLSGYTELNIVKGQMAEAEVGMVNCPVITQQPTNSIYDPSQYFNESVTVEVKNSENKFIYEWYLDGEKLTDNNTPYLYFNNSGIELDVNTMHTVTGIIYNRPEGLPEGLIEAQTPSKKDGFVRIDTVHLYPLSESDFIGVDPFEVGCYFKDKVFSDSDLLYPEDFYMNIYTKKGTIKIPHLTKKFFPAELEGNNYFNLTNTENSPTKSLQLNIPFNISKSLPTEKNIDIKLELSQ